MRRTPRFLPAAALPVLLLLGQGRGWADGLATQTLELKPGWNAIFLEVQPEPHDPASVFAGLPVESAWAWFDRQSSVEFIQNPDEAAWARAGWSVWFADPSKAFLNNLHAVFADWAYLIRVGGRTPVTWSVSGIPTSGDLRWVADSFNLVGFRVDPDAPPTFADFLAPSTAHAGQAVYRLAEDGRWAFVDDLTATPVRHGEAFWVYCNGPSTYQGPLRLELPMGAALDYGTSLSELPIAVGNPSETRREVHIRIASGDLPLAYRSFNAVSGYFEWPSLAEMPPLALDAGRQANVRLALRREALSVGLHWGVIEISDDAGSRFLVPVSAEKVLP